MTAREHVERASELAAQSGDGVLEVRAVRAAEAQAHALVALALCWGQPYLGPAVVEGSE